MSRQNRYSTRRWTAPAPFKAAAWLTGALLLATGCVMEKKDGAQLAVSSQRDSQLEGVGGKEGFRQTVWSFARENCVNCHGASQLPLFAINDTESAYNSAMGYVNFAEIPASRFVQKMKDGHCGGVCSTDGSTMVQLITAWKAAYSTSNGSGPLPGEAVPKGNVFTNQITVPASNPPGCNLPEDLRFSPDIPGENKCWTKLRFPIAQVSPAPSAELKRAWLEVDFAYEHYKTDIGDAAYVIKNPRIVSPDVPIFVHDIKFFLNGEYHPEYGQAYRMVDTVVDVAKFGTGCTVPAAPTAFDPTSIGGSCVPMVQPLFSTAASAAGIVQITPPSGGGIGDKISFSFEYLQKGVPGECRDVAGFDRLVYTPIKIGAVACLTCHKAGGQISEAGQRFNMDPNDPANGATANERLTTVCKRFLQRSNFALPEQSPIIVQPKQGLNGMPAQDNFAFFSDDWISWIKSEAAAAGH